ncbi:hypothetical protein [Nonomuraea sp. NPDC050691]|uniref:hypothetical protein n=1 Tax=Nonomuraea sp. NPDC050691 TaxID=3155661 RepID=UPI0033DE2FAB
MTVVPAVALGTAAATAATVPSNLVKTGSPLPAGPAWVYGTTGAGRCCSSWWS